MQHKIIGIDCRLAGAKNAGIGRYIENLVLELIKLPTQTHWVLFFNNKNQAKQVLRKTINQDNLKIIYSPVRHYTFAEQLKMPGIFAKENLDLLHVPHFNIPFFYCNKLMITIHDLLWHERGGLEATTLSPLQYQLKYKAYHLITRQAVHKALKIFVPAKTVKQSLLHFYPKTKNKIVVTNEGVGKTFANAKIPVKKKEQSKHLVYTGSLYPHKNIVIVLKALQKLPDYKLTLVGARSVFVEKTKHLAANLKLSDQVNFAGYLSDEKLIQLYQNVDALVQPSLSEGFGLTGVEAMSVGLPVICSDIAIFHEIYQNQAIYFNPHQIDSFIKALKKLNKKSAGFSQKLISFSRRYQWKNMAKLIYEHYDQALKT